MFVRVELTQTWTNMVEWLDEEKNRELPNEREPPSSLKEPLTFSDLRFQSFILKDRFKKCGLCLIDPSLVLLYLPCLVYWLYSWWKHVFFLKLYAKNAILVLKSRTTTIYEYKSFNGYPGFCVKCFFLRIFY